MIATRSRTGVAVWRWPDWATQHLRDTFPALTVVEYPHPAAEPPPDAAAAAIFADADVVVAWQLHSELVRAAPRLRWVHSPAAAVHQLLSPELIASPAVLTNGVSVHAATVAEHTLALLLALARDVPRMVRQQAAGRWEIAAWPGVVADLQDSTAVIVGMGHIGRALAPALKALGVTVAGVRRRVEPGAALPPGFDEAHPVEALDALLPRAHFLVLAVPETPETHALIAAPQLARLPPGARLISVGRGSALDETALLDALNAGHLGGAALDVFLTEPIPPGSPLWACDRLLISPHVGAATPASWQRQIACLDQHLRRFLAGEPLAPLVEKRRGY